MTFLSAASSFHQTNVIITEELSMLRPSMSLPFCDLANIVFILHGQQKHFLKLPN